MLSLLKDGVWYIMLLKYRWPPFISKLEYISKLSTSLTCYECFTSIEEFITN